MSQSLSGSTIRPKETPIIQSPEGVKIQVTVANKLRFQKAVRADRELPSLMSKIYCYLVDKTNEGYGDDETKFGWAYPAPKTIAEACGCDVRSVWNNLRWLEDGKTSKGTVVPERWRINVKRHGEKGRAGGRNKNNRYFLPAWHEFGAVDCPKESGNLGSVRLAKIDSEYGSFSFVDEADGQSIRTSDCMSRRQQFVWLSKLYSDLHSRPADKAAWEVFNDSDISFDIACGNIAGSIEDGQSPAFAECLQRNLIGQVSAKETDSPF